MCVGGGGGACLSFFVSSGYDFLNNHLINHPFRGCWGGGGFPYNMCICMYACMFILYYYY